MGRGNSKYKVLGCTGLGDGEALGRGPCGPWRDKLDLGEAGAVSPWKA